MGSNCHLTLAAQTNRPNFILPLDFTVSSMLDCASVVAVGNGAGFISLFIKSDDSCLKLAQAYCPSLFFVCRPQHLRKREDNFI